MPRTLSIVAGAIAAALLLPPGLQAQQAKGSRSVTPDAMKFKPFEQEKGAQIAVLYGNPGKAGHYIIRLKLAANWQGRPHSHGGAELLTVHKGTCYLALGDNLSRKLAKKLPAGSFAVVPAGTKMRGFTGADGCVVDVQGQGPFTTHYLDQKKKAKN